MLAESKLEDGKQQKREQQRLLGFCRGGSGPAAPAGFLPHHTAGWTTTVTSHCEQCPAVIHEFPRIILPSLRPNQRRTWIWWTPFNQCARGCEERWRLCPRTGVFPIAAPVSKVSPPCQVCEEMACMRRLVAIRRFHNETGETSERTSRGGSYCRMESNLWVNEMLEQFSIRLTGELRVPQCLNVFQLYNWGSWPSKLSINWSFMGGRHFLRQASCLFCLCFSMNEKTNDSEKGCSQKESPPFSL